MRAKRVMSANLTRTKTEGKGIMSTHSSPYGLGFCFFIVFALWAASTVWKVSPIPIRAGSTEGSNVEHWSV